MIKTIKALVIILFIVSISACTVYTPNRLPSLGKYVMKQSDPEFAWVMLKEDNQFEFNRNLATSYRPTGSYSIEDDVLTLIVNEDEVYIFKIKGNQLIFESHGTIGAIVEVGTVFELSNNK